MKNAAANEPDEVLLARNMIDVLGSEAASIARDNARAAALAGQAVVAKSWIRILEIIQQHQKLKAAPQTPGPSTRLPSYPPELPTKG